MGDLFKNDKMISKIITDIGIDNSDKLKTALTSLIKEKKIFPRVICKTCGSTFLSGEYSLFEGTPALIQPIPLYTISAIRYVYDPSYKINNPIVIFENLGELDDDETISYTPFNDLQNGYKEFCETILEKIRGWLSENGLEKTKLGPYAIGISVFSEIPSMCGLGSSGAFAITISEGILHIIDLEFGLSYDNKKVIDLAWIIEDVFHYESSGANIFASYYPREDLLPMIYTMSNREERLATIEPISQFDKKINTKIQFSLYAINCGEIKSTADIVEYYRDSQETEIIEIEEAYNRIPFDSSSSTLKNILIGSYPRLLGSYSIRLIEMIYNAADFNKIRKNLNTCTLIHKAIMGEKIITATVWDRFIKYKDLYGFKIAGAGGGGDYLLLSKNNRQINLENNDTIHMQIDYRQFHKKMDKKKTFYTNTPRIIIKVDNIGSRKSKTPEKLIKLQEDVLTYFDKTLMGFIDGEGDAILFSYTIQNYLEFETVLQTLERMVNSRNISSIELLPIRAFCFIGQEDHSYSKTPFNNLGFTILNCMEKDLKAKVEKNADISKESFFAFSICQTIDYDFTFREKYIGPIDINLGVEGIECPVSVFCNSNQQTNFNKILG